jgi:hypothetical protein
MWMDVDAALAEVPVNVCPLIDDTDFKTREESVVYNQSGLDLVWNFVTSAGAYTQTAVTPTESAGDYDWSNQGNGMYAIEIPASGGASINNDTEGYGWFTGFATGILPWTGPVIGFRAAGLNDLMTDSAFSATRGLAGTALPAAVADAAGGLPISDAGGLDLDTKLANTNEVTAARMGALTDWINGGRLDLLLDAILADTGTDGVVVAAGSKAGYSLTATTGLGNQTANITGNLSGSVGSVTGAINTAAGTITTLDALDTAQDTQHGTTQTAVADVPTVAEFNARTLVAASYFDPAADRVLLDKTDALRVAAAVNDASASTTVFITTLTEATTDHYKGRVVIFTSGAMLGQASDITAYNGTTKALTVTALTEAPADAVTFEIV